MSKLPGLAGIAILAIVIALLRIGSSVYDYELSVIDRNAPSITVELPHIPPPFKRRVHVTPPVQHEVPGAVCDDQCKARELVLL